MVNKWKSKAEKTEIEKKILKTNVKQKV